MAHRVLYPTGSAYIVGPENANDVDVLVYAGSTHPELAAELLAQGHTDCSVLDTAEYDEACEDPDRRIFRKGHINTLVFSDPVGFLKWAAATELALALGADTRQLRVDLFRALRADDIDAAYRVLMARGDTMTEDTARWLVRMDKHFDAGEDT